MKVTSERRSLQRQIQYIHTQRLKAFAKGKYEGRPVPSYYATMAKAELKRRGVSVRPKATRRSTGFTFW